MHTNLQIVRTSPARAGLGSILADARLTGRFIPIPDVSVQYRVTCSSDAEPPEILAGRSTYGGGSVHVELLYSGKSLCFDVDERGMIGMVSGSGLCAWTRRLMPARSLMTEELFLTPYHHLSMVNDLLAQRHDFASAHVRHSGSMIVATLPSRLVGRQTFAHPQHIVQRMPDGSLRFDYLLVRDDQAAAPGSYSVSYSDFRGPGGLPCQIRAVMYAADADGRLKTSGRICVDVGMD